MRKVFAILITLVILASGMQVSIDHHYCGGVLAATKFSITGKLASCGMVKAECSTSDRSSVDKRCCEDKLTTYGLQTNYIPEFSRHSDNIKFAQPGVAPACDFHLRANDLNSFNSRVFPPGARPRPGNTLSEIRVYRI